MRESRPLGKHVTMPSAARIYDWLLGGKDNYALDRRLAQTFLNRWPELATLAQVNRAWMIRVVRTLAESGVDQFLDVGSGLPTAENAHQAAQRVNPSARVLYVDQDPVVLSYGRALLVKDDRTDYVEGSAEDAEGVLRSAEKFFDRRRPVAVLMSAVLHYLPEPPATVVAPYLRWLSSGGYLAISHAVVEGADPELLRRIARDFSQQHVRPRAEIEAAFTGLELLDPGLVDAQLWRPEEEVPIGPQPLLTGVGRKP